jgi:DNA-binding CsgD family transcriptional regulator
MQIDIDVWDKLIGSLYDSIVRPDNLFDVIKSANNILESDLCHVLGISTSGRVLINQTTERGYEDTEHAYSAYYAKIDPRRHFMNSVALGKTYRCSSFFDTSFVSRNEFYQDFLIPRGLRYVLGSCLHRDKHQSIFIAFNHKLGRPQFSDEDERHFDRLIKHIQRTFKLMLENRHLGEALKAGEDYLYRHQHGVLGLTNDGRVSFANKHAENFLLGATGQFLNSRLVDGSALQTAFNYVLSQHKPQSCVIKNLDESIFVTALPFRAEAQGDRQKDLKVGVGTEVLVLCGGIQQRSHTSGQLMQWFGFTAAEARLARDLAAGGSVEGFANTYSVSVATVRTQLRGVLSKSGTVRQQDLIRLLLTLPLSS